MTIEQLLDQGKDGEEARVEGFVKKDLGRYGGYRTIILADTADESIELLVTFAPEYADDIQKADMGQVITVEGTYKVDNSGERVKVKLSGAMKVTGKALKEPIGSRITDHDIAAIIGMLYNNGFELAAKNLAKSTPMWESYCHNFAIGFITPQRIQDILDKRKEYKNFKGGNNA